ncbi:hypothetical protein A2397_05615 [Candidatus Amesbacteria bacterium RIFOXYB1_FULL_44_23]|uniref:Uncharacterized protein n=1 Tax=Candidatus Amesbacteria bacterium RIFOXYB1_FULL_44_23 TaxID=1797263 RepID=A0A1F4ZQ50_9BACT|nr:MAG: hypothetical protein A2397_05615 [Candidatus Amesbacteria bacterium RIFOXYB1_FULL_44_23]
MHGSHDPKGDSQILYRRPTVKISHLKSPFTGRARLRALESNFSGKKDGTAGGPFLLPLVPYYQFFGGK